MSARPGIATLLLLLALLPAADRASGEDLALWRALDWFRGSWTGREDGLLGDNRALRCTMDLFDGRFMLVRTRSDARKLAERRERNRFEYWQVLARDPDSGRITLAQYESAGYRRRFELNAQASRPDRLTFRASFLGDSSPERAGRLTLRVLREGVYEETLELGESMETLQRVRRSRWTRTEIAPESCTEGALELPEP